MVCNVNATPAAEVEWLRNGVPVQPNPPYVVMKNNSLLMTDVDLQSMVAGANGVLGQIVSVPVIPNKGKSERVRATIPSPLTMEQRAKDQTQNILMIVYFVLSDDGRAGQSGVNVAKTAPRFGNASVSEALQQHLHSVAFRLPHLRL
uniref:Ig-like domain-containing protein n=1 Tax=Anopheles culicifacies TaxID=139723 RepID=A0A182LYJ3_9DIPT